VPVPSTVTVSGEEAASCSNMISPAAKPVLTGANVTKKSFSPAGGTTPLVGSTENTAFVDVTDDIVRGPPPGFVTVTVSVCIDVTKRLPKLRCVGDAENSGMVSV
jgi:hypothetical protein